MSSRPSGGILPCDTQRELRSRLAEEGYTLNTYRKNVGNWNESRDWFARKGLNEYLLDNSMKGERPDWEYMWQAFQRQQPMFD